MNSIERSILLIVEVLPSEFNLPDRFDSLSLVIDKSVTGKFTPIPNFIEMNFDDLPDNIGR